MNTLPPVLLNCCGLFAVSFVFALHALAGGQASKADAKTPCGTEIGKPMSFLETTSGVILYVESDRHHVAALGKDGKVLWHRDLVAEEHEAVKNFRTTIKPIISYVGAALDWQVKLMRSRGKTGTFAAMGFNNKSFGLIDLQTGQYTGMGND